MAKIKPLENLRREATRLVADLQHNFPGTREILLTGCAGKEGVTALTIALARAVVRRSKARVLMIDANFDPHNRGLTHLVKGVEKKGLLDLILPTKDAEMESADLLSSTLALEPGIDVLTRGVALSVELADFDTSSKLEKFREQALRNYDFVFWDVESINFSTDSKVLLSAIKKVILVVESDVTRMDHLNSSIAEIKQTHAQLLAVLRNKAGQRAFSVGADQQ